MDVGGDTAGGHPPALPTRDSLVFFCDQFWILASDENERSRAPAKNMKILKKGSRMDENREMVAKAIRCGKKVGLEANNTTTFFGFFYSPTCYPATEKKRPKNNDRDPSHCFGCVLFLSRKIGGRVYV